MQDTGYIPHGTQPLARGTGSLEQPNLCRGTSGHREQREKFERPVMGTRLFCDGYVLQVLHFLGWKKYDNRVLERGVSGEGPYTH